MRWEPLFADLEAQADALDNAERAAEVEERARIEIGALRLYDRLRPARGLPVQVRCTGGHEASGRLRRVGPDWMLLEEVAGVELLVALPSVMTVGGLTKWSDTPGSESTVDNRLGLRQCLRRLVRDRLPMRIELVDGSVLSGTIERVGADHIEVTAREPGEWRELASTGRSLVPISALAVLRRRI